MSKSKVTATKSKNRKMVKNLNEDKRLMRSMDAFSEEFMTWNDRDSQSAIREAGIYDNFAGTTRFDNDWN